MSIQGVPVQNTAGVRLPPVAIAARSGTPRDGQHGSQFRSKADANSRPRGFHAKSVTGRAQRLSAADLIAYALEREKRTWFANAAFVEPLYQLMSSLNEEAQLTAFGIRAARF